MEKDDLHLALLGVLPPLLHATCSLHVQIIVAEIPTVVQSY